ncbi:hypothetical protein [Agromyces archimandritae]|uniref:HK97 gp10 family phage protein n=1 Tax=Agromyces archimandritae TaxID=2781962 RepID=A0A975FLU7_9MICO|nr:hypothetical protein [Agromyces archimandritae]QTX04112.1 hypothetical protein G127AT_12535 [Agromyces archimandritae]
MAQVGSDFHRGAAVQVEGLADVSRRLRAAGSDLSDMSELMHQLGTIVIAAAVVPRDSGSLAGTLRAGRGKTKAVVRAGYKSRGAHAGVVHYGDPHRGTRPQPFLTDALRRSQGRVVAELAAGLTVIIRKHGLK